MEAMDRLITPQSYVAASESERGRICNGCGPKGWKAALVPDNLLDCDISAACDRHDWAYHETITEAGRQMADNNFRKNMTRLVIAHGGPRRLQWVRFCLVWWYWLGVRRYGAAHIGPDTQ